MSRLALDVLLGEKINLPNSLLGQVKIKNSISKET
jgi:hypothetical protein